MEEQELITFIEAVNILELDDPSDLWKLVRLKKIRRYRKKHGSKQKTFYYRQEIEELSKNFSAKEVKKIEIEDGKEDVLPIKVKITTDDLVLDKYTSEKLKKIIKLYAEAENELNKIYIVFSALSQEEREELSVTLTRTQDFIVNFKEKAQQKEQRLAKRSML